MLSVTKRKIAAAAIVFVVMLAVIIFWYVKDKPSGALWWSNSATVEKLRAISKDPDSVKIRSHYFVVKKEKLYTTVAMCGVYDAKNGFGGYGGGTRFVSVVARGDSGEFTDDSVFEVDGVVAKDGKLSFFEEFKWNEYCVDEKHPAISH